MKFERSNTFFPPWPAWRVTSWYFIHGPFCYSRRDAVWQWMKNVGWKGFGGFLVMPLIRVWRWGQFRCLVCSRNVGVRAEQTEGRQAHYRYCSMECAAYDGALKEPRRSWLLFGIITASKKHHEATE